MAWGVQNLISTQGLEAARPLFSKLFGLLQGIGPRDITCLGVRKDTSHDVKTRYLIQRDASATAAACLALGARLLDADEGPVKSAMDAIQCAAPSARIGQDTSIPARPAAQYVRPTEQFTPPELMELVARALSQTTSRDAKAEKCRCEFDGAVDRACALLPKTCLAFREASSVSDALVAFLREIRDAQPLVAPLEDRLDTCRAAAAAFLNDTADQDEAEKLLRTVVAGLRDGTHGHGPMDATDASGRVHVNLRKAVALAVALAGFGAAVYGVDTDSAIIDLMALLEGSALPSKGSTGQTQFAARPDPSNPSATPSAALSNKELMGRVTAFLEVESRDEVKILGFRRDFDSSAAATALAFVTYHLQLVSTRPLADEVCKAIVGEIMHPAAVDDEHAVDMAIETCAKHYVGAYGPEDAKDAFVVVYEGLSTRLWEVTGVRLAAVYHTALAVREPRDQRSVPAK